MVGKVVARIGNMFGNTRSPYSYRPGVATGLGVGVEGLGLMKPQSEPINGPYDLRNTIRGDLGPLAGGYNKMVQSVPDVSLKGSGSGLTGALALQALAEFQGQTK